MKFASHIAVDLSQRFNAELPSRRLLAELAREKFVPARCASILESYINRNPRLVPFLDPPSVSNGGIAATNRLLYGWSDDWNFSFSALSRTDGAAPRRIRTMALHESRISAAARIFRAMASHGDSARLRSLLPNFQPAEFETIFDVCAPRQHWPESREPGIYRREHACVMIQTDQARLIFDPVCMSTAVPCATTVIPDRDVDAVLITHSHADHWHVPSALASAANADVPVVVPRVPRASLLCPDMSGQLRALGQEQLAPQWNSTLEFADIEVDVLPFYGEQPAVDVAWPDSDVRNWGNCYRVNTPRFSALLLADSGVDSKGNMSDVIAKSVSKRGPIDVIMACMRDFLSPFEIGGLTAYWTVLPFVELERLYSIYEAGKLPTTTAGLRGGGIASLCATAHAGIFVPYAQGFAGVGQDVPAGEWGPSRELSEADALQELQHQLSVLHRTTRVQRWSAGDALVSNGRGQIERRSGAN